MRHFIILREGGREEGSQIKAPPHITPCCNHFLVVGGWGKEGGADVLNSSQVTKNGRFIKL